MFVFVCFFLKESFKDQQKMCKKLRLQLVAERWPSTHEAWVLTLMC